MDETQYDEFGNYIGTSESESETGELNSSAAWTEPNINRGQQDDHPVETLALTTLDEEDDAETLVQYVDTETLEQPLAVGGMRREPYTPPSPDSLSSYQGYRRQLMFHQDQIYNVAVLGHLLHGKTSLVDSLVRKAHYMEGEQTFFGTHYTDNQVIERKKSISVHASPTSVLLPTSKGKTLLFNIVDTPGHSDFADEIAVASTLADAAIIVIDCVEGAQIMTKKSVEVALLSNLPLIFFINKLDRLILEMRMPPSEVLYKLEALVDQLTELVHSIAPSTALSIHSNIVFGSVDMNWFFTTHSIATKYQTSGHPRVLRDLLWGRVFYDAANGMFSKDNKGGKAERTFIYFILNPLYKILTRAMELEDDSLRIKLEEQGIPVITEGMQKHAGLSLRDRVRKATQAFFGGVDLGIGHLVDTMVGTFPSSDKAAKYVNSQLSEPSSTSRNRSCVQVVKMVTIPSLEHELFALGRVVSGTITLGDTFQVYDGTLEPESQDAIKETTISKMWLPDPASLMPVSKVSQGNWVFIGGLDHLIGKTAYLVSREDPDDQILDWLAKAVTPVKMVSEPIFKVAVSPWRPSDLPKMLEGLRNVYKIYTTLQVKVEESGEYTLLGPGEMYMDCVLHDLREIFAKVEIKVSDPSTIFSETCLETSALLCTARSQNGANKITVIAEPLEEQIIQDMEVGAFDPSPSALELRYGWDVLQSRSLWGFGLNRNDKDHETKGTTNIILNEVLSNGNADVEERLEQSRMYLEQGFRWAMRQGPLCEEGVRGVKVRIIDIELSSDASRRGAGELVPAMRRVCYSSMMLASPRILEPIYAFYILCSAAAVELLHRIVDTRRAAILSDKPIAGTPLYLVEGKIPVIESFGFEIDIRNATHGEASVSLLFDRWDVVPGDPLDRSLTVRSLQAAPLQGLARDFMVKTRKRKGLSPEPTLSRFVDDTMLEGLREAGIL